MAGFTTSVEIARSQQEVFAFLSNPGNLPSTLHHVTRFTPAGTAQTERHLVATVAVPGQRSIEVPVQISRSDPPRHLALTSERWGIAITFHYLVHSLQEGSRLSFFCDVEGEGSKRLITPPIAAWIQRTEGDHAQKIKEEIERGA